VLFRESFYLDEMTEKFSTLDKFHEEVNSVFILKHEFHIHKEGMVDGIQNIFLQTNVLKLVVL